jgi:hypothetical protein
LSDPRGKINFYLQRKGINMGLDMYLRTNKYISRFDYETTNGEMYKKENADFNIVATLFGMEDKVDKTGFAGLDISFPMGYWRKSNQIHNWFVQNIQDGEDNCASYYVPLEKLEELKEVCIEVLAVPEKAEELLPNSSGFFFGSQEYDEYYFGDIQETIETIDRCIASGETDFQYQSSW